MERGLDDGRYCATGSGTAGNARPQGGARGRMERSRGLHCCSDAWGVCGWHGACGREAAARRPVHGAHCAWFWVVG